VKKISLDIIALLLSLMLYPVNAQQNCTIPLPPVLTSASVQPENGTILLNWSLSPSPEVAGYIVYSYIYDQGIRGDVLDTIWNPSATTYSYMSTAYKYFSSSFIVAAHTLPKCTSPVSNVLSTIFAEARTDTCNKKIIVSWNKYNPFPKNVLDYSVMVSVGGDNFSESGKVSSADNSYVLNNFSVNEEYCFVIRANLDDGTNSTSNKACITTKMQRAPKWINADYATVTNDNKISLSFTIDPTSDINRFRLEKKSGQSGSFQQIAEFPSEKSQIKYTDPDADININNYYRLSAINNCSLPVTVSNIASNIIFSLVRKGNDINLIWNSYKKWAGTLSAYKLFMNTGNGFGEKAIILPVDTSYTISYSEIMYQVTENEVCFYIIANEVGNPYTFDGESRSQVKCTSVLEIITVPNLFTPDGNTVNDLFRPVLSFNPLEYHLIISNQDRKVVFESRDKESSWDGSLNGKPLPQGVYLWFLKVVPPSGKSISRTGTITIVRQR
jgi:gliding motility-associated-like protein